jgi:hypothetical protein
MPSIVNFPFRHSCAAPVCVVSVEKIQKSIFIFKSLAEVCSKYHCETQNGTAIRTLYIIRDILIILIWITAPFSKTRNNKCEYEIDSFMQN